MILRFNWDRIIQVLVNNALKNIFLAIFNSNKIMFCITLLTAIHKYLYNFPLLKIYSSCNMYSVKLINNSSNYRNFSSFFRIDSKYLLLQTKTYAFHTFEIKLILKKFKMPVGLPAKAIESVG